MSKKTFDQLLPILLTIVTLFIITAVFYGSIQVLNLFPGEKISTELRWSDIVIGLTIYLKTSIDFALFIGSLMKKYRGVKNRIAIEFGTAIGNMAGTVAVLIIWYFFKEVKILLGLMVLLASFVLFKLAEGSVEHIVEEGDDNTRMVKVARSIVKVVQPINNVLAPVLSKIIPHFNGKTPLKTTFLGLLGLSFSIPFILGLDDFAGYVPLFNVVSVFGFGVGVFLGHTILNVLLFIDPELTIKTVKNPIISIIGAVAFVGLACWGLYEVAHLIFVH